METSSYRKIQSLCRAPYPRHPHGCPKIGTRCKNLALFTDLYLPEAYIGVLQVDFAEFLKLRTSLHADWTDAQIRNPIQWQQHFRKNLKLYMEQEKINHPGTVIEDTPEGRGVNVFQDLISLGIPIERRPLVNLFLVSYLCSPKE